MELALSLGSEVTEGRWLPVNEEGDPHQNPTTLTPPFSLPSHQGYKKIHVGACEMSQCLRALATFAEDLVQFPASIR